MAAWIPDAPHSSTKAKGLKSKYKNISGFMYSISYMFRQSDLLLLDTTLYFPSKLKYKVFVWHTYFISKKHAIVLGDPKPE